MAPHGIYRAAGDDEWVAIACRERRGLGGVCRRRSMRTGRASRAGPLSPGRLEGQDEIDAELNEWCGARGKFDVQRLLQAAGVPAAAVQKPEERIDHDPATAELGLWPTVRHTKIGAVRVDGLPVRFSETPWSIERGGPVRRRAHRGSADGSLLGLSVDEVATLREEGVV